MNDLPKKTYEIVISYLDPAQAMVTIEATSEEDAINRLRFELEGNVENLKILNIKELDIPGEITAFNEEPKTIN